MIEQLITHVNQLIAANPALSGYLPYKRVVVGLQDSTKGFPQVALDYWDASPTGHKSGYSENMRVHLLLWHNNTAVDDIKANTMSILLCALLKNTQFDGVHFYVVGREKLGKADNATGRTRIQLDLRS